MWNLTFLVQLKWRLFVILALYYFYLKIIKSAYFLGLYLFWTFKGMTHSDVSSCEVPLNNCPRIICNWTVVSDFNFFDFFGVLCLPCLCTSCACSVLSRRGCQIPKKRCYRFCEENPGPLQKQVLLATETSLQLQMNDFKYLSLYLTLSVVVWVRVLP